MMPIKETPDGLVFSVYVQPRASKVAIVGRHADALKIKLTAPPAEGAANKQCIQVLAKALGLPKSALAITAGQSSRSKQVLVKPLGGPLTPDRRESLKRKLEALFQGKG